MLSHTLSLPLYSGQSEHPPPSKRARQKREDQEKRIKGQKRAERVVASGVGRMRRYRLVVGEGF